MITATKATRAQLQARLNLRSCNAAVPIPAKKGKGSYRRGRKHRGRGWD